MTVIKAMAGTTGTPATARVAVRAVSLAGREQRIRMREIKQQDAVYYIGEFPVQHQEILKFGIEAAPEGASRTIRAETSHQFFTR